jgi:hypothetical protein
LGRRQSNTQDSVNLYEKEQQANAELIRRMDALERQNKSQKDELNLLNEKLKRAGLV